MDTIIDGYKCLECGRFTLAKKRFCPNCLNHSRKGNLVKVKFKVLI